MTTERPEEPEEEPGVAPTLFPRLSTHQYRARLYRYAYILMRLLFAGLFLVGIWWLGAALGALFLPLLAGAMLAYLLDPIIDNYEQRGYSRNVVMAACLLLVVVLVAVVVLFMVPMLVDQIAALVGRFPELIETVEGEWIPWFERSLGTQLPSSLRGMVESYGARVADSLPSVIEQAGTWAIGAVSSTGQLLISLFNLFLVPLVTYYFLRNFKQLRERSGELLPVRRREYTLQVMARMNEAVGEWFRGQIQVAATMGALFAVGLTLVFGLCDIDPKLGIAIGILSGVLNIVPYLGAIIAGVLTALVVLLNWPGWLGVLGVVAVFVVNNLLESYVVTPRLVGHKVGISPVAVILLLLVGGELAGIWGILLIVPIAGAVKVVLPDLMAIYRQTTFYQGNDE